jgi:thiamine monophosphate synthase
VFGTRPKADVPGAIGLAGLRRVLESVEVPVIGIGGIDATNAAEVIRTGAAGVAVISSVVGAEDVEAATRALRDAIDHVRGEPEGESGVDHGGVMPGPLLG